jgi:hypothetical protein
MRFSPKFITRSSEDFESLLGKLEEARALAEELAKGVASASERLDEDQEHVLSVNAMALEEVAYLTSRLVPYDLRRAGNVEEMLATIERERQEGLEELRTQRQELYRSLVVELGALAEKRREEVK